MGEWIKALLGGLVPTLEASSEVQYAWRWRIALVSCAAFCWCLGATLVAFGMTPGFQGFAKAGDLQAVVGELRQNRATDVDNQLLELRIRHCKATTDEAKQLYWSKIKPLLDEYQRLTGRGYVIPYCTDL